MLFVIRVPWPSGPSLCLIIRRLRVQIQAWAMFFFLIYELYMAKKFQMKFIDNLNERLFLRYCIPLPSLMCYNTASGAHVLMSYANGRIQQHSVRLWNYKLKRECRSNRVVDYNSWDIRFKMPSKTWLLAREAAWRST